MDAWLQPAVPSAHSVCGCAAAQVEEHGGRSDADQQLGKAHQRSSYSANDD